MDWGYFFIVYCYLLLAALIILLSPLYLRRPVALILFSFGILINIYLLSPTPGLEWFVPFFCVKLLVSHILREEHYPPNNEI
ncbi:hypothetical protein CUJ83_03425 [Methanocella sp. CWC-04]|uniref:Uncharacterized protein n=1 Tax=Methanooceanicella nereidis TaxID=2052831 RepID=A0AAP2W4B1_9EURY|nr:hypothetical protein [Methanocella sp. CWC-04]MCD1294045.1 hypothetical protein [Methanocella sp. CWC-04]